jgi:hypothetical protein
MPFATAARWSVARRAWSSRLSRCPLSDHDRSGRSGRREIDWESLMLAWTAVLMLGMTMGYALLAGAQLRCVLAAIGSFVAGGSIMFPLGYRIGRRKENGRGQPPVSGSPE